jgi:hypothetical protein
MPKKGYKQTEEHKKKVREMHIGVKFSEEIKQKMSKAHMGQIAWNKGKKRTMQTKIKSSMTKRGITDIKDWNGFSVSYDRRVRNSPEYKKWRERVFKRDDYTCQKCGARSAKGKQVYLHSHHILSFTNYPFYRFLEEFGQTLCVGCHKWQHKEIGKKKKGSV